MQLVALIRLGRIPDWIDHTREETYHLLCADPVNNLPRALTSAVKAAEHSTIRARQWAELIADAGRDTDHQTLRQWGQRLEDGIHDSDLTQYFTYLINDAQLDKSTLIVALEERGECHRLAERYDEALADFNRAIELDPNYPSGPSSAAVGPTRRWSGTTRPWPTSTAPSSSTPPTRGPSSTAA